MLLNSLTGVLRIEKILWTSMLTIHAVGECTVNMVVEDPFHLGDPFHEKSCFKYISNSNSHRRKKSEATKVAKVTKAKSQKQKQQALN